MILVEVSAKRCREPKKKGKKKTIESENGVGDRNLTPRSRSWTLTAPAALPNEQAVADLPCIQHILDANRLTWSDVGHHADCQFASFIHASQQQEPTWDLIIDTRRSHLLHDLRSQQSTDLVHANGRQERSHLLHDPLVHRQAAREEETPRRMEEWL